MKLIDWFVRNPVAANLVMVAIVVAGVVAMSEMNRERFPAFSIDRISISAVYESASPEEVSIWVIETLADGGSPGVTSQAAISPRPGV